jgi:acetolactate synthase I/II/III large subunit
VGASDLGLETGLAADAKCAAPGRPVVAFTGDAGPWYYIAELETAAGRGPNTVTVVNNISSGIQTRRGFGKVFDRAYGGKPTKNASEVWGFNEVDFARVEESMGTSGIRVTKPNALQSALAKALETVGPVVIDVVTDIDAASPLAI